MLAVRIAHADEIARRRADWNTLVCQMRYPVPFCSWEWAQSWLGQYGGAGAACALFVEQGDTLRGILPLFTPKPRWLLDRWLPMAEYLGTSVVYPDHLDVICAAEHGEATCQAIAAYLVSPECPWTGITIPAMTSAATLSVWLPRVPGRFAARRVSAAPYIPLPAGFDSFLGGLSRNERYKLRNRSKKLLALPGVKYVSFGAEEFKSALNRLHVLHGLRAEQKNMHSTYAMDSVQSFHDRLIGMLPPEQVMLRALAHEGVPFAIFYGFRFERRVFYFQLGFDPKWADHSPGLVLLTQTIREAIEFGSSEYNFLQGEEPFKRFWTREHRDLHDVTIFGNNWRGRALQAGYAVKALARLLVRRGAAASTQAHG